VPPFSIYTPYIFAAGKPVYSVGLINLHKGATGGALDGINNDNKKTDDRSRAKTTFL
jgi:hypothetical protein